MKYVAPKKTSRKKSTKALAPAPSSPGLDRSEVAVLHLSPQLKAATLILKASSNTNTCIDPVLLRDRGPTEVDLLDPLRERMQAVSQDGNMKGLEEMLVAQAHSLDALFFRLAKSGMSQTERPNLLALLGLAIRAQGACRATIETLSAIKNPPSLAFVRQANIAGVQQVNNGQTAPGTTPARENANTPNKLMEVVPYETKRLDAGAPTANASGDSSMEALEVIDWAQDPRGKGQGLDECVQGRPASLPASIRPRGPRLPRRGAVVLQTGKTVSAVTRGGRRRNRNGS